MEESLKEGDYKLLRGRGMGAVAWGIFSLVVIVILVTGGFLYVRSKRSVKSDQKIIETLVSSEVLGTSDANDMLKGDNAVVATDTLAGNTSLIINTIKLKDKGFVVIQEDNKGKPGKAIGNSDILAIGEKKLFMVKINRATKAGETLYAILYKDDGSGIFEESKDEQIKNENRTVAMRFKVL